MLVLGGKEIAAHFPFQLVETLQRQAIGMARVSLAAR
jgi:hypothetical protein